MDIEALKAQLVIDEGLRLMVYQDSQGISTVGVGHNLEAKPISERAAMLILEDDIEDALTDLDQRLPWWRRMNTARQEVLANMCFNLGIGRLLGFKKALAAMEHGEWNTAAHEMLDSRWAAQTGARAKRLAQIMRNGE